MAIRTTRELATHLRQNAANCEQAASRDVLPDDRARLLIMADRYWRLADKIDEPRPRWQRLLRKPFGFSPPTI